MLKFFDCEIIFGVSDFLIGQFSVGLSEHNLKSVFFVLKDFKRFELMINLFIEFFDSVLENILILNSFFLRMNILGFIMFHLLFILHRNSQLYMLVLIVQLKLLISKTSFVKLIT